MSFRGIEQTNLRNVSNEDISDKLSEININDTSEKYNEQAVSNLHSELPPLYLNSKPDSVISNDSYLPWNDYFMSLCYLTAARSKDPNTKVGACIVDKENRIVSLGYNGMPRGIKDEQLPWNKEGTYKYQTKYPYVCHAEMNAILNERLISVHDCCIYVSKFPCCECAKLIIQSGIKRVIYSELKPDPLEEQVPTNTMFSLAGIICRKFVPSIHHLSLDVRDGLGKVSITK
ncbi:deoxycytidylate deaminase [Caerostris darwini]|uniref:Probable deoxycytidylate deaminase n=1 Tax=Caerostris darwini TaxID=1538125 RepID=A0AAV4TBQ3_9ARAC|nr:deoxycytidylate deaminase [Caerostris darwini]